MSFRLEDYDYGLPEDLIAKEPAKLRDSSRLLIYDRASKTIIHDYFYNIKRYIPKNASIILNNTKVIKARLFGTKKSGGKIELLFIKELVNHRFLVNIKGKVKKSAEIFFKDGLTAAVKNLNEDGSREVEFFADDKQLSFTDLLPFFEKQGHIPLPPYLKRDDNKEDEASYQTVFAKHEGSVAAPTASLHFTKELLEDIKKDHKTYQVTLHVGAGTFKGVESEDIRGHQIHSEVYDIPKKTAEILDSDAKILCVGTTSTRTVEYYHRTKKLSSACDLFLHPGNPPQRADYLLTNFHLPKSTLIMLVASLIGLKETQRIYNEAIEKRYRFFSYGDGMLIL